MSSCIDSYTHDIDIRGINSLNSLINNILIYTNKQIDKYVLIDFILKRLEYFGTTVGVTDDITNLIVNADILDTGINALINTDKYNTIVNSIREDIDNIIFLIMNEIGNDFSYIGIDYGNNKLLFNVVRLQVEVPDNYNGEL